MQNIKQKLKSEQGVSILFALLLFLVASMVSVTILTAAVSSIKSRKETKDMLQNNITLESAASMLRAEIDGASYSYILGKASKNQYNYGETVATEDNFGSDGAGGLKDNLFKTELVDMAEKVKGKLACQGTFTIMTDQAKMEHIMVSYVINYDPAQLEPSGEVPVTFTLTGTDSNNKMYLDYKLKYQLQKKEQWITRIDVNGVAHDEKLPFTYDDDSFVWTFDKVYGTE